ncbi:MAG: hypothetical protein QXF76_03240 [Candidatus Anstonellales archaeon]
MARDTTSISKNTNSNFNYVFITTGSNPEDGIIEQKTIEFKSWLKLLCLSYGIYPIHETRFGEVKKFVENNNLDIHDEVISNYIAHVNTKNVRKADLIISLLEIPSIKTGFLTEIATYDFKSELPIRIPVISLIPKSKMHNHALGSQYAVEYNDGTIELKYTNKGKNISLMYDGVVDKYIEYNDRMDFELYVFDVLKNLNNSLKEFNLVLIHEHYYELLSQKFENDLKILNEFFNNLNLLDINNETHINKIHYLISNENKNSLKTALNSIIEELCRQGLLKNENKKLTKSSYIIRRIVDFAKKYNQREAESRINYLLNFNKKFKRNKNAFIIGSITNVRESDFGNHLDLKMSIVELLYNKYKINASFALLDNEAELSNYNIEYMPYLCYLIDQLSVKEAGLLISLYGNSLGTGLELARAYLTKTPTIIIYNESQEKEIPHLILGLSNIIAMIKYTDKSTNEEIIHMLDKKIEELEKLSYLDDNNNHRTLDVRIPTSAKIKIEIEDSSKQINNNQEVKERLLKSIKFRRNKKIDMNKIVKKVYYT